MGGRHRPGTDDEDAEDAGGGMDVSEDEEEQGDDAGAEEAEEAEDMDLCSVCKGGESFADNQIVFCDGPCLKAYHQFCRTPVLKVIPEGDW